jgi:hypothetical protein
VFSSAATKSSAASDCRDIRESARFEIDGRVPNARPHLIQRFDAGEITAAIKANCNVFRIAKRVGKVAALACSDHPECWH